MTSVAVAAPRAIVALGTQAARAAAAAIEDIDRKAAPASSGVPARSRTRNRRLRCCVSSAGSSTPSEPLPRFTCTAPGKLARPGMRPMRSWASASSRITVPARSARWQSTMRPARAR
jgi:hypothetical protein